MPDASGPADYKSLQDVAAFARLVREHQPIVLGLCQSMGLRGADIDDAAAEAFAAVYRALPGFRGDAALSTWVYRIALRRILRVRQKFAAAGQAELPDLPDTRTPLPGSLLAEAELQQKLWDAVAARGAAAGRRRGNALPAGLVRGKSP